MPFLEIATDHPRSAVAAEQGGADRIELTSALALGGLSPSMGLLRAVRAATHLPVYVMIRPRMGGFCYTEEELTVMEYEIESALAGGADGLVFGCLTPDHRIDERALHRLLRLCAGRPCTFHRAFDLVPDFSEALDILLEAGVQTVLTSGGKESAPEGVSVLRALQEQAQGRIQIMAGGGLRGDNLTEVWKQTGVSWLHGSAKRTVRDTEKPLPFAFNADVSDLNDAHWESDVHRVAAMKAALQ